MRQLGKLDLWTSTGVKRPDSFTGRDAAFKLIEDYLNTLVQNQIELEDELARLKAR